MVHDKWVLLYENVWWGNFKLCGMTENFSWPSFLSLSTESSVAVSHQIFQVPQRDRNFAVDNHYFTVDSGQKMLRTEEVQLFFSSQVLVPMWSCPWCWLDFGPT
jgi:hypothetical protein